MGRFQNDATEAIYRGKNTKDARNKCPREIWSVARRKLSIVREADTLEDIRKIPGNRYEKLEGDREGRSSIRINDQYRVTFKWKDGEAREINIVDYH
ncbi:MAG: type II toxin-antitoxin system RelE/ParE family toxin [bacterium]